MATIVNERDVILQATTPRMLLVASNFITVSSTTNTFSTTASAVSPSSIVVRASLSGELRGTVVWTVSPNVAVSITGNVVSVPSTSVLPGIPVTLTASLTLYGQTYTDSIILTNVAETVTSTLSASAAVISTAADGTGGVYTSATSTMSINIGTVDNSSAWTFAWTVPAGVTATGQATRTILVSNMTVDSTSLTCTATRSGWPTQTATFTISKSKAGSAGPAGSKTALIYAYKRSASLPTGTDAEPGTATYSFVTNTITTPTLANSWLKAIPAGSDPLYVVVATAAATGDTDTVDASEWTDPVLLVQDGISGLNTASVFLYARNSTPGTAPTVVTTGSSTYTFSNGSITGQPSGWTRTIPSDSSGNVLWVIQATASNTTATDTIANTEWSSPQILAQQGAPGSTGPAGNKVATVFLYQWASAQPGNPSGQSTYTWNPPGNASYTGGNSWQTSISSNPGTPLLRLWVASKSITAAGTDTTTTVSWTTEFTISSIGQNGDTGPAGVKTAAATVFQWALTIPTISGTSTYTWSNAGISPVPSGWTLAPGTPTAGFTLWEARVNLLEAGAALTSSINWTTSSILAVGYAGQTGSAGAAGLSARIAFARVANNPSPVTGNIVTSGTLTFPSSAQSTTTWGFAATWGASDPNPSSTDSLYQCDGIFNPATNQTTWTTPYISSLKVGSLSAITVNTGALTVQDTLTVGTTGSIRGGQTAFNTGTGFFLGYDSTAYKFSIGTFSVSATINTTQDTLTVSNHGYLPGDAFYVLNNNGNTDFTSDTVYYVHSVISTSAFRVTSVANAGSSFTNLFSGTAITIAARNLQWTGTTLANYGKLDMYGDATVLGNLGTFRQRAKLSPDRLNFYRQSGSSGIFNGQDVQTAQYDANGFFIYTDSKSAAPSCSISDSNGLPTLTITKRVAVSFGAVVEISALNGANTALEARGRISATNQIRTTGTDTSIGTVFSSGKGLELVYLPAINTGYLQSYNRDTSTWTQLYISGSRVTVNGAGADGSIGLLGIGTENFGTSATNTIAIRRATTAPTSSPTGVGQLYVDGGSGHLMFRHDNGTVYQLTF